MKFQFENVSNEYQIRGKIGAARLDESVYAKVL